MISPQRHRDHRGNSQLVSGEGFSPAPCPPCLGGANSCKTKPNLGRMGHLGYSASGGRWCETKPRSGGRWSVAGRRLYKQTQSGGVKRAKRTQFGWSAGGREREMRKTNPIPARPGGTRPGGRGTNVRNKPNAVRGPKESSACWETSYGGLDMLRTSAKQSQFAAASCKTNPSRGEAAGKTIVKARGLGDATRHWGNGTKQSQFFPRGQPSRERNLQNEPNLAGRPEARRGKCAKRTQFRPGRAGRGLGDEIPHHSDPMPMVRNEAIVVRQSGPSSCYIGVRRSRTNRNNGQSLP